MSEDTATAILSTATAVDPAVPSVTTTDPAQYDDSSPADSSTAEAVDPSSDGTPTSDADGDGTGSNDKLPTTPQIRAALKAFRDASPEHAQAAKMLNDGYSRAEAFKEVFGSVDDARNVKTQLDAVGGLEGLAGLQASVANIDEVDAKLASGDPSVLDSIIEDSPEGFKKLAPHYLNRLQKLDPEAFASTVQPHLISALDEANFPQVISYLESQLGDKPELKKVVDSMKQWYIGQKQLSDRYKSQAVNPEREKLQEGFTQLEKERRADLDSHIRINVDGHIRSELGTRLAPYAAALNAMPLAQRQDVARACINTLAQALKADKAYQTQVSALMSGKKPDRDKIVSFNKQKVTALADRVIEAVVKSYSLKPGGKPGPKAGATKAGAQKTPVSSKIIQIGSAPKDSDINWKHPNMTQEAFIRGRAILNDGRMVAWKK